MSSIIVACETRLAENGIPPEQNLSMTGFIYEVIAYIHPNPVCTTSNSTQMHALLCLHPAKLFLNFGNFVAP